MSQTSYSTNMDVAVKGMLADCGNRDIVTYNNPTDQITFGYGVVKVAADDDGCKLPDAAGNDFLGVAVKDMTSENEYYSALSAVPVIKKGRVWVVAEEAVTPDDSVFCRHSGRAQIQTFVLDADLVNLNVITVDVDGTTVSYTYAASHAASMAAFAALIQAEVGVATAVVGGAGDRTITITAAVNGVDVVLDNEGITLGASQANIAITETVTGVLNSHRGQFRNDADTATAFAVTSARFMTSASAGEVVEIDLNRV